MNSMITIRPGDSGVAVEDVQQRLVTVSMLEESQVPGVFDAATAAAVNAFRKRVEDAGYSTMLYGNGYDLDRYTADYLDSQAVWWAEYGPEIPTYKGAIAMWQYTSGGEVAGVNGGADMSIDLRGAAD